MVKTSAILFKDLLRSMLRNFKQLISIVAISFLATCLFCGLMANAKNVEERADLLFERTDMADIYVTGSGDEETIAAISGVEKAESRLYLPGFVDRTPVYLAVTDGMPSLSHPDIIQGEYGVSLTETYANGKGLEIGDEIEIDINSNLIGIDASSEIFSFLRLFLLEDGEDIFSLSDIPLSFTVTGFMYHAEGAANSTFSPTIISLDESCVIDSFYNLLCENYDVETLEKILRIFSLDIPTLLSSFLSEMENQVLVRTSIDPALVLSDIEAVLDDSSYASLARDMSFYTGLHQEVEQAMQLTFVFPVIFFLVSLLIILTTLSQLIIRERKEVGSLKAMGVSRMHIYLHYVLYGALLVLLGALLGFVVGPLFIPNVLGMKYDILWDIPSLPVRFFHPLSIALCLGLVLLSGLCSFFVSFSVIREKPVDTLRPKAYKGQAHVASPESFYSRHTSIPLRMAIRNVFRNKGKSLMVVLGMLGCTALLVCGFGIMDTLDYDIALDYGGNMRMDVTAMPIEADESFKKELSEDDRVARVEDYLSYPATFVGEKTANGNLCLVEDDPLFLNVDVGLDGGLTLDSNTAEQLGLSIGDVLTYSVQGQTYSKRVTVIFQSSFLSGVYDLFSAYPENLFEPDTYYITLKDSANRASYAASLRETGLFLSVMTYDDVMEQADNILSTIATMTDVVKIFAILLSVVVIYNLTALNIAERERAIATMKVLGFRFMEISKTLTYELLLDAVVGSLIGLAFGYPMTVLVLSVNKTDLLHFIYHITPWTYLIALAISLVTTVVVSLLLNLKTKKISMSESLKSVE